MTTQYHCGWAGEKEAEQAWGQIGDRFAPFFIAGAGSPVTEDTEARCWELFQKITGKPPNLTPQPTGNCVAAGARDAVEGIAAFEIAAGEFEEFHPIFDPFHYATGRVLVGRNRLRGSPGSLGSWQAEAIKQYGVLRFGIEGRKYPKYTKQNVDAWGDGRGVAGVGPFTDFTDVAREHVIKSAARLTTIQQIREALTNYHLCTIAANYGYSMKPQGGKKGYHRSGRPWPHQMSLWGIGRDWIAIKNQWGDVHGELVDLETGEPWPRGFLRVPLEDFENHLRRAEVYAFSRFEGFPQQKFDFGSWV